jgi:hypothetical protein
MLLFVLEVLVLLLYFGFAMHLHNNPQSMYQYPHTNKLFSYYVVLLYLWLVLSRFHYSYVGFVYMQEFPYYCGVDGVS